MGRWAVADGGEGGTSVLRDDDHFFAGFSHDQQQKAFLLSIVEACCWLRATRACRRVPVPQPKSETSWPVPPRPGDAVFERAPKPEHFEGEVVEGPVVLGAAPPGSCCLGVARRLVMAGSLDLWAIATVQECDAQQR